MESVQLKLKQASAVLGVTAKDLQNFVQAGVLRPRRRADVFWFDTNLLLQAKVAFYLKASLRPAMAYLAQLSRELSRVDLTESTWDDLLVASSPGRGKSPVHLRIPLRQLKKELDHDLPLADAVPDLPRGRKRSGWKADFVEALRQAGDDMGEIREAEILNKLRAYRAERKKKPEIRLVTEAKKSA